MFFLRNLYFLSLLSVFLIPVTSAIAESYAEDSQKLCQGFGPQTPRDISNVDGANTISFSLAPDYQKMNLCNIHSHTNAEHKGPGFSIEVNDDNGGFACNETASLTEAELTDPFNGEGAYKNIKPGDTIEMHWVHSSCDVQPGEGLGACLSEACANPDLRVETQVFLVVNDKDALDFNDFDYGDTVRDGYHQAKAIPSDTGEPIQFLGSTTGPSFTEEKCSPLKVTWSVRPQCAKVDISSLHKWAENNVFKESVSQGVRQLVTSPELLAPIQ